MVTNKNELYEILVNLREIFGSKCEVNFAFEDENLIITLIVIKDDDSKETYICRELSLFDDALSNLGWIHTYANKPFGWVEYCMGNPDEIIFYELNEYILKSEKIKNYLSFKRMLLF